MLFGRQLHEGKQLKSGFCKQIPWIGFAVISMGSMKYQNSEKESPLAPNFSLGSRAIWFRLSSSITKGLGFAIMFILVAPNPDIILTKTHTHTHTLGFFRALRDAYLLLLGLSEKKYLESQMETPAVMTE